MTAEAIGARPGRAKPLQAIAFLGLAIVLLPTSAALLNGALGRTPFPPKLSEWATLTHFTLVFAAVPLAMIQIAMPKGTLPHRTIGYVWCALLIVSAIVSFAMHELTGGFSPPHAFSIMTLVFVPLIVFFARTHRTMWHLGFVFTLIMTMVLAGVLTFLPGRAIADMFWPIFG